MEAVSKETIEVLNYAARYAMDASHNAADLTGCGRKFTPVEACMAILPAGWEVISEDENTSLIRTPSGLYVNLWTEGVVSHDIEDGGIGFDDQIDHYEV